MAERIGWDKFEVALLIDACNQVLKGNAVKSAKVSELSAALRKRAENNGVKIDEIFRNENGISLQITKMNYLLTGGKVGLPGASKLYAEIAELSKSHPADFTNLLVEAQKQIGIKGAKANMSIKEVLPPPLFCSASEMHGRCTGTQAETVPLGRWSLRHRKIPCRFHAEETD